MLYNLFPTGVEKLFNNLMTGKKDSEKLIIVNEGTQEAEEAFDPKSNDETEPATEDKNDLEASEDTTDDRKTSILSTGSNLLKGLNLTEHLKEV